MKLKYTACWGDIARVKLKYTACLGDITRVKLGEKLVSVSYFTAKNLTWTDTGPNPGLHGERPEPW